MLGDERKEVAHRRELPRGGSRSEPTSTAFGKKGPQICCSEGQQRPRINHFSAIGAKEIDQAMRCRDIGPAGVGRTPSIVKKMACPALDESARRMLR